ncbi:hypothetical protein LY76DRAFT_571457 [Colletotrichum caudatum]|nr:hypothetical protein LY76DRAFT_571457 [Colletotrichum caudatum]
MRGLYMGLGSIALVSVNANQYPNCEYDNCYRNLVDDRFKYEANVFCVEFLNGTNTAPDAIPADFDNCEKDIKAVSSACSCVTYTLTHTVPVTTSTSSSLITSTTAPSTTVSTAGSSSSTSSTTPSKTSTSTISSSTTSSTTSTFSTASSTTSSTTCTPSTTSSAASSTTSTPSTASSTSSTASSSSTSSSSTTTTTSISSTTSKTSTCSTKGSSSTSTTFASEASIPLASETTITYPVTDSSTKLTTSTIYTTRVQTLTQCAPDTVDCSLSPITTTQTIAVSTTVCPLTEESNRAPVGPVPTNGLTTSTIYTTRVETVTTCASSVSDCPDRPYITTRTFAVSTTVCPVNMGPTGPVLSPPAAQMTSWVTSTIYTTNLYTVTACKSNIPGCVPTLHITTEVVPVSTTICPVTESVPQTLTIASPVSVSKYPALPVGTSSGETQSSPLASSQLAHLPGTQPTPPGVVQYAPPVGVLPAGSLPAAPPPAYSSPAGSPPAALPPVQFPPVGFPPVGPPAGSVPAAPPPAYSSPAGSHPAALPPVQFPQ